MGFDAEHDEHMENMLRTLTMSRCLFIVGAALASKFPTEHDWEQAMSSPVLLDGLLALQQVWSDIESTATNNGEEYLDPDKIIDISEQHYDRAIEAISEIAEYVQVPADDLLMTLING